MKFVDTTWAACLRRQKPVDHRKAGLHEDHEGRAHDDPEKVERERRCGGVDIRTRHEEG